MTPENSRGWWQARIVLAAILIASIVPLIWPAIPPLTDLPGHAARWHIATADPASPLHGYYRIHLSWLGNLGADLPALLITPLIGPIATARLIAMLTIAATVAAMLMLSREVHGRIAPTALLALPLAYGWPYQMGFINFAIAQAIGLWALILWLRLGRSGRTGLRAGLFAPIAMILWTAHSAGWGMFGLMAFGAELARLRGAGRGWAQAIGGAVLACLPLAVPLLVMIANHPAGARASETGDWFNLPAKLVWFLSTLRDRWKAFDLLSLGILSVTLYAAARERRLGFDARLGWPALVCLTGFLLLPRLLLGGSYVDMRMMPMVWMLALLAIRPPEDRRFAATIALAGLAFFTVRTGATTLSFVQRDAEQQAELGAVAAIPRGAAVLALVYKPCLTPWSDKRAEHLPALAIIGRDAFVNEQWAIAGQHYLTVRHSGAAPFTADPSQLVYPDGCATESGSLTRALATFPRAAFSHVWIIDRHIADPRQFGFVTVWSNDSSALYEVVGTAVPSRVERRP